MAGCARTVVQDPHPTTNIASLCPPTNSPNQPKDYCSFTVAGLCALTETADSLPGTRASLAEEASPCGHVR